MPFNEEHELSFSISGANDAFWFLDERLVVGGLNVVICRLPSLTHCLFFLRLLLMLLEITRKYKTGITDMVYVCCSNDFNTLLMDKQGSHI